MRIEDFKSYAKELLNIALPIIMGNLGFILIGAGDVFIAGRHSTQTLAAISIATAIINCIFIIGMGLIGSISPVLSNYRGERKSAKRYFYPTIRFSMTIAVITTLLTFAAIPLIDYLKFEPELTPLIKDYIFITAFSTFGAMLHMALKEFLQAFEIVFFPNLVTVFSVFLNVLLNIIFVFGAGFIPSMGVKGLAIASLITRYFMGFALLALCYSMMSFRNYKDSGYYKTLIKVGLPMSFAVLVEFVAFNSVAIIMGKVAGIYAAAQNLVCTLTTVSFMVPFAISNAIAVKVGFANGSENFTDLKRYAAAGTIMGVGFMMLSAMVFVNCPHFLVGIFTKDLELIKICVPVIYILALFQVFDGIQVSLAGIFKGIKRTEVVLIANLIGYWFISIPLGYYLAIIKGKNIVGFWIGLVSAAVVLCSIMGVLLVVNLKNIKKNFCNISKK